MVILLLMLERTSACAQENLIIDTYSVFENNSKVYLDWVIKSGNTCNGINIQRSTDSINFSSLAHIEGVCGNLSSPQPFSFIDEAPVNNSLNYYRLELGGKGYTRTLVVDVIGFNADAYQLRPNPANEHARLYFDNPGKESVKFNLYDQNGKELITLQVNEEYLDIDTAKLSSGLFVFTISNVKTKLISKGKIIIQK